MLRNTTAWKLGGTLSFRLASKQLKLLPTKPGANLQNQPDSLRRIYKPSRNGYSLVQADQAGAEALIVAYLTPRGNYREIFLQGIKPHTYVAMNLFKDLWAKDGYKDVYDYCKLPINELNNYEGFKTLCKAIKQHDERYYIGKKTVHSFSYRMHPTTFIVDVLKESEGKVVLTKQDADKFYFIFHNLFPEISGCFYKEVDYQLHETRTLRNLFRYPRVFDGPYTDKFFREATSFIPQSTVGTITNKAFVYLQRLIEHEHLKWNLLNNCHDSILLECPEEESLWAGRVLGEFLSADLENFRGEKFKMKVEVSIGKNWGKWKEKTNPEGMKEVKL